MSVKVSSSCCLQSCLKSSIPHLFQHPISKALQSSQNLMQRRAVELVLAAIDVAHQAAVIDYERGGVRNVNGIRGERVMEPVGFGHGPILIEQKDAGDGMLLQESSRLPHAVPLFGGNEHQLCSRCLNFSRLELSHALHAVRSPSAAQKLENQRALCEQSAESKCALTVGRSQGEIRRARPDLQSVCAVLHVEFDFKRGGNQEQ